MQLSGPYLYTCELPVGSRARLGHCTEEAACFVHTNISIYFCTWGLLLHLCCSLSPSFPELVPSGGAAGGCSPSCSIPGRSGEGTGSPESHWPRRPARSACTHVLLSGGEPWSPVAFGHRRGLAACRGAGRRALGRLPGLWRRWHSPVASPARRAVLGRCSSGAVPEKEQGCDQTQFFLSALL